MLKIVLDSNVYISALLFRGIPHKILTLAIKGKIKLIISGEIIRETAGILRNKFYWPEHNIDKFVRRVSHVCEIIETGDKLNVIKDDASDNMILECAVNGNADLIISGDKHLLRLKVFRNIPIKNPRYFTYLIKEK
ncbi:MAG: putative toxin-antitoxin system toxin component, PIN family [Actinomycetota bacterium]|nr:putative toxin-antitoxin system toxin component, PIN family [Actinomycetota bacterium]